MWVPRRRVKGSPWESCAWRVKGSPVLSDPLYDRNQEELADLAELAKAPVKAKGPGKVDPEIKTEVYEVGSDGKIVA